MNNRYAGNEPIMGSALIAAEIEAGVTIHRTPAALITGYVDPQLYERRVFYGATVPAALCDALAWMDSGGVGLHVYDLHLEWEPSEHGDADCVIVIYSGTDVSVELLDDEPGAAR